MAAAGKYLRSCHGTRLRIRMLLKQSLSENGEGDGDTVSLRLPCGPSSQHAGQTVEPRRRPADGGEAEGWSQLRGTATPQRVKIIFPVVSHPQL